MVYVLITILQNPAVNDNHICTFANIAFQVQFMIHCSNAIPAHDTHGPMSPANLQKNSVAIKLVRTQRVRRLPCRLQNFVTGCPPSI